MFVKEDEIAISTTKLRYLNEKDSAVINKESRFVVRPSSSV